MKFTPVNIPRTSSIELRYILYFEIPTWVIKRIRTILFLALPAVVIPDPGLVTYRTRFKGLVRVFKSVRDLMRIK